METLWQQIGQLAVAWLVPALLGALAGWAGGALGAARRERAASEDRADALADGVRSLLRCELVRAHEIYVVDGEPMGVESLEYVQRTYDSYHRLGGNDVGTHLYRQIIESDGVKDIV